MLPRIFLLLVAAAVLSANRDPGSISGPGTPGTGGDSTTFHAQVEEVQVTFSAEDNRNQVVRDMVDSDISVLEDGKPVERLTSFRRTFDRPLHLALAVDLSDSMQKGFPKEQRAAQEFLQRVVRPDVDFVFLVEFASQMTFSQPPPERPDLIFARAQTRQASGLTALYDALYEASYRMNQSHAQPLRRAIILMSDGEDNLSMHGLQDVIETADRFDVAIYALTAHQRRGLHPGDSVLRQLAQSTGGRAFVLNSFDDADQALGDIEQELRTQYSLAFRPVQNRCGFHRIAIVHRNRQVHIRARDRYYQCRPALNSH